MLEAMNEFGVDTLKAARTLEAAGFESSKAEALVTVFGGPAAGNVATKVQVRDLEEKLSTEIRNVRTGLKAEIQGLRTEVRAEFADVRLSIEQLRTQTYRLMLTQTVLIVGLILTLDRLL